LGGDGGLEFRDACLIRLLLTVDFLECGGGDGENCVLVKVIEIIDLLAVDEYRIFIFLDG
jgi:hypothetical protein